MCKITGNRRSRLKKYIYAKIYTVNRKEIFKKINEGNQVLD